MALTIASDPSAAELDAVQFDSGTGPSVIAVTADEPVAAVLVERPEWRVLSELAAERDVASTVAYGLAVKRADALGSTRRPHPVPPAPGRARRRGT